MAARQPSLLELEQNLVLQLRGIATSDINDFDELSDKEKKTVATAAILAGYPSALYLFYTLKLHPELTGAPALPKEELGTATVKTQTILANVQTFLTDKDAIEKVKQDISAKLARERFSTQKMVERMVIMEVARRQAEIMALRADQQTTRTITEVGEEANLKQPPLPVIVAASAALLETAIPQIEQQQHLSITPIQREIATQQLATLIIAGTATESVDLADPAARNELIEIAIAGSVPQFTTATSTLYHQIEQNVVVLTSTPKFDVPNVTQVTPEVTVTNLDKIEIPGATVPTISLTFPPSVEETIETAQKVSAAFVTSVSGNNKTDEVMATLAGTITKEQETKLVTALMADNLITRALPTREGAAAAKVIETLNPTNPFTDAATTRLVSMGLVMRAVEEKIAADPNSATAKVFHENPGLLNQLKSGTHHLENLKNDLGKEISDRIRQRAAETGTLPPNIPAPTRPGPLTGIGAAYQNVTNRISGFLPGRAGQVFSAVTHPVQFIQSRIGNFIGNRVVGQFKHWLAEKVVSRIANETVKKAAEFLLKRGIQEGVKLLAKEGLKRGLQLVAQAANIAPGAGLLLAAAIEAAFYIGEKTIGLGLKAINNISRALTGEDFDFRVAAAAPLMVMGGIGGALAGVGSASIAAAASAGVILLSSVAVGSFLYVTVLAVAPIISSIAQLESSAGAPYQLVTGGVVPEGCPSGWPVASGYVTQGPRTTSTHRGTEAIDIGIGNNTPIIATHNGLARYNSTNGPYGNFIDVTGTCNGIAFTTRYAHMNIGAFAGEKLVTKGENIGLSDDTGNSTGPHLHYEIRGGNLGDINQFLPKRVTPGCIDYGNCQVNLP